MSALFTSLSAVYSRSQGMQAYETEIDSPLQSLFYLDADKSEDEPGKFVFVISEMG